jgi:hypothetical protein
VMLKVLLISWFDYDSLKSVNQLYASDSGLTQNRTKVGVIHELPLRNNQGFSYILRKSYDYLNPVLKSHKLRRFRFFRKYSGRAFEFVLFL